MGEVVDLACIERVQGGGGRDHKPYPLVIELVHQVDESARGGLVCGGEWGQVG